MYGDDTPSWTEAQIVTMFRLRHQVRQHGSPPGALRIALAVALDESTCRVLSSDAVPESQTSKWRQGNSPGDHLSVGLFQQQPGWGPDADLMSPYGATQRFLTGGDDGSPGLLDIPRWASLDPAVAAARVQRNEAGASVYRARLDDADRLVALLRACA